MVIFKCKKCSSEFNYDQVNRAYDKGFIKCKKCGYRGKNWVQSVAFPLAQTDWSKCCRSMGDGKKIYFTEGETPDKRISVGMY